MSAETIGVACLIVAALTVYGLVIFSRKRVTYDPKKPKGPPRDVPPPRKVYKFPNERISNTRR